MDRFEWMSKHGFEGAELGTVGIDLYGKFLRYSMYLNRLSDGKCKTDAISEVSEATKVSERWIYKDIKFFEQ